MILFGLFETIVLVGGTVHTMLPDDAPHVADVRIEDGRIVAVGVDAAAEVADVSDVAHVSGGARRIDVAGMHVLPGLVDGMVSHDAAHDVLYIARGVTLVRDSGNQLARILAERAQPARDRAPGPDLVIAGAVLDGAPPATTESVVLTTPAEVQDKLPRLFELGVDYLSLHVGLPSDLWEAVIKIAHAHERAVWGPRLSGLSFDALVAGDQDGLFHLDALLPRGKTWEHVTYEELEPAIEALAASGMAVTPTLAVYGERLIPPPEEPTEFAYLGKLYERAWMQELAARKARVDVDPEGRLRAGLAIVELQGRVLKRLHERGVTLVPGSASPHPWLFPGEALISELSLWVRAGLSRQDVLQLATAGAAQALGLGDERGTIAPGQVADVIVVQADPRVDLTTLVRPEVVVVRGRAFEREQLDQLLDDLVARQAQLAAELEAPLEIAALELPEGQVLLSGTVETTAAGQRVSGERFAVVREPRGTLSYCGRMRTPGTASYPASELALRQRIRAGLVENFRLRIRSGTRRVTIRGHTLAGEGAGFQIERSVDGKPFDDVVLPAAPAFVEAGSITAHIVLGREAQPGYLDVLFFEDTEPATGAWEMRLDTDNKHLLRTALGDMIVRFDARGVPALVVRRMGNTLIETRLRELDTFGGPGLPLPDAKRPAPIDAAQAAQAAPAAPAEAGHERDATSGPPPPPDEEAAQEKPVETPEDG